MNRPTCCWATPPWNSRTRTCSGVDTPRSRRFTPKAVVHHAGTSMSHTSKLYRTSTNFFFPPTVARFLLKCKTEQHFIFFSVAIIWARKKRQNNLDCAATPERNSCSFQCDNTLICTVATFPTVKCENKLLTRRKSGASEMLHNTYSDNF